jgi:hypothetical protein
MELRRFIDNVNVLEGRNELPAKERVKTGEHWASEPLYYEEVGIVARVLLAHVHLDRGGDWGEAEKEFLAASQIMSEKMARPEPILRLSADALIRCSAACDGLEGRLRLVQGRIDEAIHKLNYALRLKQNAEHYLWLATAYANKLQSSAQLDATLREKIVIACQAVTRLDPAGRFETAIESLIAPAPANTEPVKPATKN